MIKIGDRKTIYTGKGHYTPVTVLTAPRPNKDNRYVVIIRFDRKTDRFDTGAELEVYVDGLRSIDRES